MTTLETKPGTGARIKNMLRSSHANHHLSAAMTMTVIAEWCPGVERMIMTHPQTAVAMTGLTGWFLSLVSRLIWGEGQ